MTESLSMVSPESDVPVVDYHLHTTFSDGDSRIEEYVMAAEDHGLDEIAFTDHVWRSSDWLSEYVETIEEVKQETPIRIHVGVEAKVIDDAGRVDVAPEDADRVDFVMGVVHRYQPENEAPDDDLLNFDPDEAAARERDLTLAILENNTVDLVGHPSRTYYKFFYGDRTKEPYPTSHFEAMIARSKKTGTPLEYNARLPTKVRQRLLSLYGKHDVPFTIGSDSHHVARLENLDHAEIRNGLK